MLSALILNLQLRRQRKGRAEQKAQSDSNPAALPLDAALLDASNLQLWLEELQPGAISLQLFCPDWQLDAPCRVALSAFGQDEEIEIEAGSSTRNVACAIALALDRWFDVTLPTSPAASQRVSLTLRTKTRPDSIATSTDGMVLLQSDGRGFDVEVGLDDPFASGGVVTVAVAGRVARLTTHGGQHGAELMRQLMLKLQDLGCTVALRDEHLDASYRARVDVLALSGDEAVSATRLSA